METIQSFGKDEMVQAAKFMVDPGWKIFFTALNINAAEVFKHSGLPVDLFSRKDATLTVDEYFSLWNSVYTVMQDPLLPIKMLESYSPESFHPVFFASLCSPNLNVALQRIRKYKRLVGPLMIDVAEKKDATAVSIDCLYKTHPLPDSLAAFELLFLLKIGRIALRKEIVPQSVTTTSDILYRKEYRGIFAIEPSRGKKNRIVFSANDAASPFITENQNMWSFFEPELRKRLKLMDEETSYAAKVRDILFELLPSGLSSAEEVSQRLGMSKRSLQRYLNTENTSFQEELNRTRENLARHYLKNSHMSCGEISFLLGYDDPNSFVRAYKSWTGETPGTARIAMRH